MNTKYTVLLPAYKPDFFEEALRSIKSQTLKDFKVLVSDDCSPHDLKSIYNKVCGDDPRFSYRRNEKNIGGKSLVEHWNLLVDLCKTDFLIMASDDDIYSQNFLDELDKLVCKYPNVDLFHARIQTIDELGEVTMKDASYEEYATQLEFLSFVDEKDHQECVPNYVYRTHKLKQIGGFVDLPLAWFSDTATNNLMAANGCVSTQDILFSFRMSGQNISCINKANSNVSLKKIEATYAFYLHITKLFDEKPQGKTKLDKHIWVKAYNAQIHAIVKSFQYYSTVLPFHQLVRLIKFMSKQQLIHTKYEKIKFITKWLYAKKYR